MNKEFCKLGDNCQCSVTTSSNCDNYIFKNLSKTRGLLSLSKNIGLPIIETKFDKFHDELMKITNNIGKKKLEVLKTRLGQMGLSESEIEHITNTKNRFSRLVLEHHPNNVEKYYLLKSLYDLDGVLVITFYTSSRLEELQDTTVKSVFDVTWE